MGQQLVPGARAGARSRRISALWNPVSGGPPAGLPGLSIRGLDRPTWPEVRPDVVREERQDLVRHLPLRLGQSLLDEAVDRDPNQLQAGAQREVELVEHGFPLLQQMGDIGHELVDDTVDLMRDGPRPLLRICDRYRSTTFWCSLLGRLELH